MQHQTLSDRIVKSAAFAIGANIIRQSIGIVSLLILARLLSPEDYGIVAAAMLVVQLFEVLSQTGTDQYVLSRSEISEEKLNSAWTLRLLVRVFLGVVVMIMSPYIAIFFKTPELAIVIAVTAMLPILDALQSPGVLILRRELKYNSISKVQVLAKILSFIFAVSVAYVYRSYWALVCGNLVAIATFTVYSYRLHPARPKLTLSKVRDQLNFSFWTLSRAIVGFTRAKFDNFAVGRSLGVVELGLFTVSKQLATMPHMQLTESLRDIFMTSIGGSDTRRMNAARSLSRILVVLIAIMLPIAVGMSLTANAFVLAVLGDSWLKAVPMIEVLSVLSLTFAICAIISNTLIASGNIKKAFSLDLVTLGIVVVSLIAVVYASDDPYIFALTRGYVGCLIAIVFYTYAARIFSLNTKSILLSTLPSGISALCMWFVVSWIESKISGFGALVAFLVLSVSGAVVYSVSFYILVRKMAGFSDEILFMNDLIDKYTKSVFRRIS